MPESRGAPRNQGATALGRVAGVPRNAGLPAGSHTQGSTAAIEVDMRATLNAPTMNAEDDRVSFRAESLDDILRELYPVLLERGSPVIASRGLNKELIGIQLELLRPRARLSRTETRGRPFSALGEFLWYLTKDNRLDFIVDYIPAYAKDSEDGLTVHGGYGPRLFRQRGNDQVENAIRQLRESPTSRRAVIQIFDAEDNAKRHKEVPCTTTLQLLLRERKLHLIATMRSNDAWLGLPHDVFCFTMLQEAVARILGVDLGTYRHFAASMHLYEDDQEKAASYLQEGFQRHVEMPPMPEGDSRPAIRGLFDAERRIRGREPLDAGGLGLDPYWADLVRLLQIHFAQGDDERLDELRSDLAHAGYRTFVEGRRGKKPLQAAQPAQRALSL